MSDRPKTPQPDASRLAAAQLLTELGTLAEQMAERLRDQQPVPWLATARLVVDCDRMLSRLSRHHERLKQPES